MAEFNMPSLGADMQSGTLIEWNKKPGDEVKRGDIIAVVGTEKGDIEVEVFDNGVIVDLLVQPGTEVPVGNPIAIIRGAGEPEPVAAATPPKQTLKEQIEEAPHPMDQKAQVEKAAEPAPAAVAGNGHRIRVSPLARKLAAELGVDLEKVHGSGPHGA
ncbi:MAG: E3 binding domain-containing protein, partial [Chloroflexota bacterium]|nr:E3 binding domain-containing protein [Chloroflexota bacterium]